MLIDKIYVDMDGVIANFNKAYKSRFGISPKETRERKEFEGYFKEFIKEKGFSTLEPMPDMQLLLQYLNSLPIEKEILSSTANEECFDELSEQKSFWLDKQGITYKANFVPGKQHKYKWATLNSIIIDDTESVINDWINAGGIGILHKDAISTINFLEMYI
jgi:hypothetical protein